MGEMRDAISVMAREHCRISYTLFYFSSRKWREVGAADTIGVPLTIKK